MNDNIKRLDANIKTAWEQVKLAVSEESVSAAQTALDKVTHLENLKRQQIVLDSTIAASTGGENGSDQHTTTPSHPQVFDGIIPGRGKSRSIRPKEIRIGSFKKSIRYLNEIPQAVANFLIEQGKTLPTFRNFIHSSDADFEASAKTVRLGNGQYMEIGDDKNILVKKARTLLDSCGYRALKIEIFFENGSSASY